MYPVVQFWRNFLTFPGVLLGIWHHFRLCQETPSPCCKTPERDLKHKETLDKVQDVRSGVFENLEVPDKAWDGVKSFPESNTIFINSKLNKIETKNFRELSRFYC